MSIQETYRYTIKDLFEEDVRFEVPFYQRSYSWDVDGGKRQVRQFIADLEEQHPDKDYYLGHFLFEQDKPGKLLIIDGQQRLTTVVIFIAALVHELERRNSETESNGSSLDLQRLRETYLVKNNKRRFQTVKADKGFFGSRIIDRTSVETGDTHSRKRIAEADAYFAKTLRESTIPELERWTRLIETAAITTFPVTDKIQATQIFAFQNDRGKDLTQLEKLKAFLMYQIYLNSDQDRELDEISDLESAFGEIYTITPRLNLDEDQVLGHHCTTYLRPWGGAMDAIKTLLGKCKSPADKVAWITQFVTALNDTFAHVEKLEELALHHMCIADPLILDASNSWPLLLKLYRNHREAIISSRFSRLLRLVEMATFKRTFLHQKCSNNLPNWAFHHQPGQEDHLQEKLEHASRHSFNGGQECGAALRAALSWNSHWQPRFRYLLWKYENSLREDGDYIISPGIYINDLDDPRMGSTLDHIIPRNPKDHQHEEAFNRECLHDLGNLMLMTHSMNASYGRKMPLEKWEKMSNSTLASHRAVGRTIQECGGWDRDQIESRKKLIVQFALDHWEADLITNQAAEQPTESNP